MWDLAIPGDNDHDFYVAADESNQGAYHIAAGGVLLLVHNDDCPIKGVLGLKNQSTRQLAITSENRGLAQDFEQGYPVIGEQKLGRNG